MPRGTLVPRRGANQGSGARPERPERPERPRSPLRRQSSGDVDEQVLRLRETGASYSAIARCLELRRAVDAHRAFVRAVGRRDGEERRQLVANESARLDKLELRIRQRDAGDQEKIERRLLAVDRLRQALS